jgi:hypothetical protein
MLLSVVTKSLYRSIVLDDEFCIAFYESYLSTYSSQENGQLKCDLVIEVVIGQADLSVKWTGKKLPILMHTCRSLGNKPAAKYANKTSSKLTRRLHKSMSYLYVKAYRCLQYSRCMVCRPVSYTQRSKVCYFACTSILPLSL